MWVFIVGPGGDLVLKSVCKLMGGWRLGAEVEEGEN
jgi:hypothetical protein